MGIQALLIEAILSGFFAIACFRSMSETPTARGLAPQRLFVLTDRIERLRRSRWQWFSIVLLLIVVRMQMRAPLIIELTALVMFIIFLALPSQKKSPQSALGKKPLREALRRS